VTEVVDVPDVSGAMTADERDELERLRAEVVALRAVPPPPRVRRRVRWASVGSAILLVLGLLLVPVSVLAVWTNNQVSNTERFVATVSPVAADPAVQAALANRITAEVTSSGSRARPSTRSPRRAYPRGSRIGFVTSPARSPRERVGSYRKRSTSSSRVRGSSLRYSKPPGRRTSG
jgi:hypothetical protein